MARWRLNTTVRSRGAVRAFYGNFGCSSERWRISSRTSDGLRQTTEDAVLNANYIRKGLEGVYDLPYSTPSMHEVVFQRQGPVEKGREDDDSPSD